MKTKGLRPEGNAPEAVLFVMATPIGNLDDMTFRAVETLKGADLVICEDTRRTGALLAHFGARATLCAHHDFNERQSAAKIAAQIGEGRRAVLVTDAGTPAVSDPGLALVRECVAAGIRVTPIPGASAVSAALSVSHIPAPGYLFAGFAPPREAARRRFLKGLASLPQALVFFEAPHRIAAFLKDAQAVLGDREAMLGRELTKLHEEFLRGRLSAIAATLAGRERVLGEITLVVEGLSGDEAGEAPSAAGPTPEALLAALEGRNLSDRDRGEILSALFGLPRNAAYRLVTGRSRPPK